MRPPYMKDYSTTEDFDLEDADWIDVTVIGSNHEVQVDCRTGTYRNRKVGQPSPWKIGQPET